MQIYRYWARDEREIEVDGQPTRMVFTGASNLSYDDALRQCGEKARRVQQIINGEQGRRRDYSRPIQEQIVEEIDRENIVTRNRYGALVLNSTTLSMFDIDSYQRSFWEWLRGKRIDDPKAAIVEHLQRCYAKQPLPGSCWRIYETAKGIRLLITGMYLEPSSETFATFSRSVNADSLYTQLCIQQNCYRARLSPKPQRIAVERIRYPCPIPAGEEEIYQEWLEHYTQQSTGYGVCRLLETLGQPFGHEPIVRYHDNHCCKADHLPLA